MSGYKLGDTIKFHFRDVDELCNLRKLSELPCRYCVHQGIVDCPEVRKKLKPNLIGIKKDRKTPI